MAITGYRSNGGGLVLLLLDTPVGCYGVSAASLDWNGTSIVRAF